MPLGVLGTHVVLPNTSHLFVVKEKRANGQEIRLQVIGTEGNLISLRH